MTFDNSQHCIELLSHAVLSKLNPAESMMASSSISVISCSIMGIIGGGA